MTYVFLIQPLGKLAWAPHAMHVYSSVRDGLAMAIEGEYQRNKLIERRMRGAGLIIPANGPVTKWHTLWVETGACTEPTPEGKIQQLVLGTPTFHFRRGIATVRHDIRPDRCPPTVPPPNTLHLYLGTATDNTAATWSIVMVRDGDGLYNGHATIVNEGAGPAAISDHTLPTHAAAIEAATRTPSRYCNNRSMPPDRPPSGPRRASQPVSEASTKGPQITTTACSGRGVWQQRPEIIASGSHVRPQRETQSGRIAPIR